MTITEILDRLDALGTTMRVRAGRATRPIDQQLYETRAEAYEAAAVLVRQYDDA